MDTDTCRFCGKSEAACTGGGLESEIEAHDYAPGGVRGERIELTLAREVVRRLLSALNAAAPDAAEQGHIQVIRDARALLVRAEKECQHIDTEMRLDDERCRDCGAELSETDDDEPVAENCDLCDGLGCEPPGCCQCGASCDACKLPALGLAHSPHCQAEAR